MGEVRPVREGVEAAPADLTDAIGLAYRKASAKLACEFCAIPRQQVCTILLNGIVDNAARGMRDVDQLCDAAFALLRRSGQVRAHDEYQW
jgi:hypothetical protein